PSPRLAVLRTLYDPADDGILDPGALVLYFPAPHSFTGEDVLELHIHGGPATITAVLAAVPQCAAHFECPECKEVGAGHAIRYAEPGEFTRLAFLNKRLSLPQIEALSATLSAQTEQQRRVAARGSRSALSDTYEAWRMKLLLARGELEAIIDFHESEDFDETPEQLAKNVAQMARGLLEEIKLHRANAVRGELLRSGISVAFLGAPNAGKSSLLNRVVGREAAIVSREAGTTRDIVDVNVDLAGWYVKFGDMAGLRGSNSSGHATSEKDEVGEVEQEGIRRAKERALQSDVVVVILAVELDPENGQPVLRIDPEVVATAHECATQGRAVLVAINKTDKLDSAEDDNFGPKIIAAWRKEVQASLGVEEGRIFAISCRSEAEPQTSPQNQPGGTTTPDPGHIQAFLHGLTSTFSSLTQPLVPNRDPANETYLSDMSIWQDSLGASERQRVLLEECMGHLEVFLAHTLQQQSFDVVVAAESLRAAADCLARVTGRGEGGDVEEVLGVVFEK
ncbi:tRNA modification GTPase mss1 mitochondrial precursor, partial [Rhizodiscina lignyota]